MLKNCAASLAAVLLAIPIASAGSVQIQFEPPASGRGEVTIGAEWALVLFPGDPVVGNVSVVGTAVEKEFHEIVATVQSPLLPGQTIPADSSALQLATREGSLEGQLFSTKAGSLYVTGQISLQIEEAAFSIEGNPRAECANGFVEPPTYDSHHARFQDICPSAPIVIVVNPALNGSGQFQLSATAMRELETHSVSFDCASPVCGKGNDEQALGGSGQANEFRFYDKLVSDGKLAAVGHATKILLGGTHGSVSVNGNIRLPLAKVDCGKCSANRTTLNVAGPFTLSNITVEGPYLSASGSGTPTALRLDETVVSPRELLGSSEMALVAGTAAGAWILKLLLAPFFTRLTKEEALEHPRRKTIFDYIQTHPGANFREVARETGIAAGTVRHHLNVLERSGQVVERQHGSTVRLFENHGKFDATWSDVVLLREEPLGQLHAWLKENPGAPQKAALEAMEAQYHWSRSTTQHRLSRLVEGGLATIRLQGRLKLYSVAEKGVAKPPPGLGPSFGPSPTT